jgi:hypothetical protein
MADPLEALVAGLRAAVDRELEAHHAAVARVRDALATYESAVRSAVQADLVKRAAGAIGIAIDADDHARAAQRDLQTAVDDLLALTKSERPAAPPRDVATPEQISAFVAARSAAQSTPDVRASLRDEQVRQRQILRGLLDRVGAPRALDSDVDQIDELDALTEISEPEERARWDRLPREHARLWLTHLVARARFLRERSAMNPSIKGRLRDVIVRFPEYAAASRPGHVNGMRLEHEPVHGSWDRDARATYAELRAFVDEPEDDEEAPSERPSVRKSRAAREPVEPIAWKYRDRVAEARIVMFGGSIREDARDNLETSLGIGTLEWVEGDKPRRVDALEEAIARGNYDAVVVLARFVHHKDADKLIAAAKRADVPFAALESGYGVEALRAGLEAAFDAKEHARAG